MLERSATQVKWVFPDSGGDVELELAVDSLNVTAEVYIPSGGVAQEDYDGNTFFQPPTFRLNVDLNYDYERTEGTPEFNTVSDVVTEYISRITSDTETTEYPDVLVGYDEDTETYDPDLVVPNVVLDLQGDDGGFIFSNQAREKPRSLSAVTSSPRLVWDDVKWTFE